MTLRTLKSSSELGRAVFREQEVEVLQHEREVFQHGQAVVQKKFFAVSMLFYLDKNFFMGESMILHMNLSMTFCCLGMDLNLVNHTQQRT